MARRRRKLVYLVGFMGSGKSTVGAALARELNWPFIDLDNTIEAAEGRTIREIFEAEGEAPFRTIEHAVLTEASKTEPAVISLGGGTFVQKPNLEFIRQVDGVTIWLDCSIAVLRHRCSGMTNRPLFRDPASFEQLYQQRLPYYQLADYRISTETRSPDEVVKQIVRLEIF
jgi:shikimate kinase